MVVRMRKVVAVPRGRYVCLGCASVLKLVLLTKNYAGVKTGYIGRGLRCFRGFAVDSLLDKADPALVYYLGERN